MGYFDLIASVDQFVLLDEVQYTRRDWRNRNRIKTAEGAQWLTIPVETKGRFYQKISETRVGDPKWSQRHWNTIQTFYGRAAYFARYRGLFEELYLGNREVFLSRINRRFLEAICAELGLRTLLIDSAEFDLITGRSERLLGICRQSGATTYLSGPAARGYLDEELFADAGIEVRWADYSGYKEYRQLYPPFVPDLSIVDLIFNEGPNARHFLKTPENT